jgi:hypothetical protein
MKTRTSTSLLVYYNSSILRVGLYVKKSSSCQGLLDRWVFITLHGSFPILWLHPIATDCLLLCHELWLGPIARGRRAAIYLSLPIPSERLEGLDGSGRLAALLMELYASSSGSQPRS